MKSRQVPFFLYWRVENVQFWVNSIGHLGWLSRISNFPRFHKNVNSLELWKYISENSSPKGFFDAVKENPNFPSCRGILDSYRQWLLNGYFPALKETSRISLVLGSAIEIQDGRFEALSLRRISSKFESKRHLNFWVQYNISVTKTDKCNRKVVTSDQ